MVASKNKTSLQSELMVVLLLQGMPLCILHLQHTFKVLLAYSSSSCAWFDMAQITVFLPVIGIHTRRGEWDWGADGDIPHDQTDQSACWDAGAAQAGSTTPSISPSTGHKHTGTDRGTPRVCMLLCPAVPRLMTSEFPIRSSTGCQGNGGNNAA